jgi:O-antigen ligase
LLIDGSVAARRELGGGEAQRLAVLVAAGLAAGAALGHPLVAAAIAAALWLAWRLGGFAGVFAVCLGVVALGSASIHVLKAPGLDERWIALGTLALWPLVSRRPVRVLVPRLLLAAGGALAVLAFISATWSVDPWLTLQRSASFAALLWVALVVVPLHAATPAERRELVVGLGVLCGAGALTAFVAGLASPSTARATPRAFVYFNGLPDLPEIGPLRGWLETSNTLGIWCALLLPFLMRVRRRAVAVPAVILTVAVILWSYSRAALVVLVIVLAWHAYAARPRSLALGALIVAAAVLVVPLRSAVVTNSALAKFQRAGGSDRSLLGGRLEAWDATVDLIRAAPMSGFGFGTGDRLFKRSGANHRFVYFTGANSADAYLQAVVEVGPVGLIALVAALAGGLGSGLRRRMWSPDRGAFVLASIGFAVTGVTESMFTSAGSAFTLLMWSSLGVASAGALRPGYVGVATVHARRLVGAPVAEPLVALLPDGVAEEEVVATNGRRDHAVSRGGSRNGSADLAADIARVQVGAEDEAEGRIPGDRPA